VKRLEVGIFLREIAKGAVHLEADLEIRFGVADIAEKSFVAPHVVVINRLFQQGNGAGDEEIFCFGRLAQLVQTKARVQKTGAGVGRRATKLLADAQGEGPFLFLHQVMKPELQDFRAALETLIDGVEFGERLARHAQLCVAAGGLQLPFKLHALIFSTSLAKAGPGGIWLEKKGFEFAKPALKQA
jgi:hypothetical protein